jgi:hypothetical protein
VKKWPVAELPETRLGNIPGGVCWSLVALFLYFIGTRFTEGAWVYIVGPPCVFTEWIAIGFFLRAVFGPNSFMGD